MNITMSDITASVALTVALVCAALVLKFARELAEVKEQIEEGRRNQ